MKHKTALYSLLSTLLALMIAFTSKAADKAVMSIDGNDISTEEFLYLYNKNVNNGSEKLSPREYASMFALYKMKVLEAMEAGIDTTAAFKAELEEYCNATDPSDVMLKQEYHDGILLFEISNIMVWARSTADNESLCRHFENSRERFRWEKPRAKGWILFSDSKENLDEAEAYLNSLAIAMGDDIRQALKSRYGTLVVANRFLVERGVNPMIDALVFEKVVYDPREAGWKFACPFGCRIIDAPEEWTDVKGDVIADYQSLLAQQWENDLWNKHRVVFNYEVIDEVENI